MIIGIAGPMGSGKGEAVRILAKVGFGHITLSSMVREEARRRGLPEEREALMEVGNSMRAKDGTGVLAKRALEKVVASGQQNWVIDGIRNPAEIDVLRQGNDVSIVGIDSNRDLLVSRIISRDRFGDTGARDEIVRKLKREWGEGEPEEGQQLGKCLAKVDHLIRNEGTLKDFEDQFLAYYNRLREGKGLAKGSHSEGWDSCPSKDEYYLDLAKSVCRRATCTKVEMGAVIIREDQVVSTGYNGSPRGTKSSLEHGFCLRKKLGIPSGQRYEMCRSVHAEQNAIINAARAGVTLLGGDIYIYGKIQGPDDAEILDAFPCFICKKMLINCGLKRVICSLKGGGYKVFSVEDWIQDWRKNDIIDDQFQYGVARPSDDSLIKLGSLKPENPKD